MSKLSAVRLSITPARLFIPSVETMVNIIHGHFSCHLTKAKSGVIFCVCPFFSQTNYRTPTCPRSLSILFWPALPPKRKMNQPQLSINASNLGRVSLFLKHIVARILCYKQNSNFMSKECIAIKYSNFTVIEIQINFNVHLSKFLKKYKNIFIRKAEIDNMTLCDFVILMSESDCSGTKFRSGL